jgi:hypothetical protein
VLGSNKATRLRRCFLAMLIAVCLYRLVVVKAAQSAVDFLKLK